MGGKSSKFEFFKKASPLTKVEEKMIQVMKKKAEAGSSSLKSFNSVIMKFPKIDENFENVREVFQRFDKDSSGTIDIEELKECFRQLHVCFTDQEIIELHQACDMDESKGIDFKEFIVLLCLAYLMWEPTDPNSKSRIGLPNLESTFDTIVDTFRYFDKDGDGYVSKKEIVQAINDASPGGRDSGRIGIRRFEEMDFDKNGMITFKEFLFAFTHWVGVNDDNGEGGE